MIDPFTDEEFYVNEKTFVKWHSSFKAYPPLCVTVIAEYIYL